MHQFYANILALVNINLFLYINNQFALGDLAPFNGNWIKVKIPFEINNFKLVVRCFYERKPEIWTVLSQMGGLEFMHSFYAWSM